MSAMRVRLGIIAVAVVALGCDLRVSTPGQISDEALNEPAAVAPLVNGMGRTLSRALGWIAFTDGAITREIVAAGSQNGILFGITLKQRAGDLDSDLEETNEHWKLAQQARWQAEDGARRMRDVLGADFAKSASAAQALVFGGFANRLLGENMCDGIIDGGPIEPRKVYFERAQTAFSEAITIAAAANNPTLERAARAGRASVRVWLNDWPGAMADAGAIPSSFVYQALYSATELDQYNRTFWANANMALRNHSVIGTFYESYYLNTRDPRTPWSTNPTFPRGTQNVLWLFQTKYTQQSSPMNLVSGREMRLIVAEGVLRAGDWAGALASINQLRAEVGVVPWTATSIAETWTALGRERGIELWLEGRRLGDLYRLKTGGVPGQFDDMTGRDLCYPIGLTEMNSNPNLRK
jgi:hypothetical protein